MKLVLYNNVTNKVIGYTSEDQTLEGYMQATSEEEKAYTSGIYLENIPTDYYNYKVVNNKLIKMSEREIKETRQYGKILTEEERLLNQLIPSRDEIQKAKNTIEMINLIQEVM